MTFKDGISPVCIPDPVADPELEKMERDKGIEGRRCWVTGWGHTQFAGNNAEILQQAELIVDTEKRCFDAYQKKSRSIKIDAMHLCASAGDTGRDACQVRKTIMHILLPKLSF